MLEFVEDASPVVVDAVEFAVFDCVVLLLAVPPALPVVLLLEPEPLSWLPSRAEASALWLLRLAPLTDDLVSFPPVFELALWWVETRDVWMTAAAAMGGRLPRSPASFDDATMAGALFVAVMSPELSWLPVTSDVLLDVAFPVSAIAEPVPSFDWVGSLVACPPMLPVWLFDEPGPLDWSPPLALASALWSLPLNPCTLDEVSLPPLFECACCVVRTLLCWKTTAAAMLLAPLADAAAPSDSTEAPATATVHMTFLLTLTDAASLEVGENVTSAFVGRRRSWRARGHTSRGFGQTEEQRRARTATKCRQIFQLQAPLYFNRAKRQLWSSAADVDFQASTEGAGHQCTPRPSHRRDAGPSRCFLG